MAADSISNRRGKKDKQQQKREHDVKEEGALGSIRSSLTETAEHASDYVSGGVREMRDRVRETTRDREGTVVFVALAVGFGIGVALGTMLAPQRRPHSWRDRITTEGLGQRVKEGLESVVPERLAECFSR